MKLRLLPHEEWPRLAGTELEKLHPHLAPDMAQILVVEEGDSIVGTWAIYPQVHAEGVWIDPAHRAKGAVAKHLMQGLAQVLAHFETSGFVTSSVSEEVTTLIKSLGGEELPGRHFVVPAPHSVGA